MVYRKIWTVLRIQLGQPATVKVVVNLARLLSYNNKDRLQTGLIVGGWEKYEGGKIYGIPLGGTVLEQPFAIRVSLAIAQDGASGGIVRIVTINKDGATRKFYPTIPLNFGMKNWSR
ncbi:proteasome chaperone 1 [Datura stramonium]|uniref:Proteasome chaperone 1 n=1 Tax=Datura stramonium TaxID=4076 RepID=A0ABS8T2Y5_DATST|nr:proteasome chaperone 1 [Datura stramonium]